MRYLFSILCLFLILSCGTESTPVYTLSTSVVGEGSITPSGGEYEEGSTVTLTSTPNEHWLFNNWSGDGSGSSSTVTITMDRDMNVVGNFQRRDYPLTITIEGEGEVKQQIISSPKTTDYPYETVVQLTPVPDTGWEFVEWNNWDGEVDEENKIVITVDGETNITVTFERIDYPLNITILGEGNVQKQVDGEITNLSQFPFETEVTLTAMPASGWVLNAWALENHTIIQDESITVSMNASRNIRVEFKIQQNLPTISTSAVTQITSNSAISGGTISSDGGSPITNRGVCIGTAPNPSSNCTSDGTGTGSFTSTLSELSASTTYYIRAFATNSTGLAYGNEVSFTTEATSDPNDDDSDDEYEYLAIGVAYQAQDGLTVTLNSYKKIEKSGSIQYQINYTLTNNTEDQEISQGQFKLFYANSVGGLQQYGAFNNLFPGDTTTRQYTFEATEANEFKNLAYSQDIFFAEKPPEGSLVWNIKDL